MAGQKQDGTTVNITVSTNTAGLTTVSFNDPFSMNVALQASSGLNIKGAPFNNRFELGSSTADTLMGGTGNDIFVVANGAVDLGGDVLKGGAGVNIVQLKGSGAEIDLTGVSAGTVASSSIEAVVGNKGASGEIVDLGLSNLTTSTLNFSGAGPGKAFVAMIGQDGQVNLSVPSTLHFVGVLDASGAGFAADGTALDTATTAALAANETPVGDVLGSLAQMYLSSTSPAGWAAEAGNLSAYVFSSGAKFYTIWTDGTVNEINPTTTVSTALYQPVPAASSSALGTIPLFDPTTAGAAAVTTTSAGVTSISLTKDAPGATGAIVVSGGATGLAVHGDHGVNGGDYFNLANSGGANLIYGTPGDDIFELGQAGQASSGLIDTLFGRAGFDIVHAPADGANVDLTGASNGVPQSTGIDAVVGNGAGMQTVELNLSSLAVVRDPTTGFRTSVFEALMGSSADVVTVMGKGNWKLVGPINPGDPLPTGATALQDATALDKEFNGSANSMRAENTLVGNLFELMTGPSPSATVSRYITVWTDATLMVQGMAGLPSGAVSASSVTSSTSTNSFTTALAAPGASA